ncbi:MAG: hypothetical protein QXJ17_02230 [Nitrososphaeria archaeon]
MNKVYLKNTVILATIALIALTSFTAEFASASADNNVKKGQNRMAQEQMQRLEKLRQRFQVKHFLMMNKAPNFVDFISTKEDNTTQAFLLRIHKQGVPSIYVAMADITKEGGNKTLEWVNGLLKTFGLIEYQDKNNDGFFLPADNDTRLQFVNFAKLDWKLSATPQTINGTKGWAIELTAEDRGAKYTIRTKIFNTGVVLGDGTPIAPNEAKVDFIFENFPWVEENSRLALVTSFGGVSGLAQITHYDNSTEVIINRDAYAYFTWASEAFIDEAPMPVIAYKKANGTVNIVEFNYPHGNNITHDPVIGVASGNIQDIPTYQVPVSNISLPTAYPGLFSLITVVTVITVIGVIVFAARKVLVEPKLKITR